MNPSGIFGLFDNMHLYCISVHQNCLLPLIGCKSVTETPLEQGNHSAADMGAFVQNRSTACTSIHLPQDSRDMTDHQLNCRRAWSTLCSFLTGILSKHFLFLLLPFQFFFYFLLTSVSLHGNNIPHYKALNLFGALELITAYPTSRFPSVSWENQYVIVSFLVFKKSVSSKW